MTNRARPAAWQLLKKITIMKTSTFIKRVDDLLTKKGTLRATYNTAIDYLKKLTDNTYKRVYPLYWSRNMGRYILIDNTYKNMRYILNNAGVDYVESNDAPRGGKEGVYIELTKKGRQQLKNVDFDQLLNR